MPSSGLNFLDFPAEFDVIEELTNNREAYMDGTENLSLSTFPRYLLDCVRRIQRGVKTTYPPGVAPILTCCIVYGLQKINESPHIQYLLDAKSRLDDVHEDVDMIALGSLRDWFDDYRISIPDGTSRGSYRQNIVVPEAVKGEVCRVAKEMGAALNVLSTFAVIVALVDHPSMITEMAEEMKRSVKVFFRSVEFRAEMAKVLLTLIK